MYTPSCTYRIQFNNQFTFQKLVENAAYLRALGIGCIYASPVLEAVAGSNHGYDVTNPGIINPEIGTLDELIAAAKLLKKENIGWIQDIVPNHMAFHPKNKWLMDVFKFGRKSSFSDFFDVDWDHPLFLNKIMVPVLGKSLKECLDQHEISLSVTTNNFYISYYDFTLPVNEESISFIKKNTGSQDNATLCEKVNGDTDLLQELLSRQHYILAFWQDTSKQINYRRFFSINGLICLNMEQDSVFEKYHELIFKLVERGTFSGLRIDHVDGLKMPVRYFEKIRTRIGNDNYVVIEKIIERSEKLDTSWPIQGTTGYDFLAIINNVFTNSSAMPLLKGFYREVSEIPDIAVRDFIFEKKRQVLKESFQGDLDNICRIIEDSGLISYSGNITPESLKESIGLVVLLCPVYKFYSENVPLYPQDAAAITDIFNKAKSFKPGLKNTLKALSKVFLDSQSPHPGKATDIFLKLMQYTGPLMAKGIEDTAMYAWACFIAHNEVGDSIDAPGIRIPEFHKMMESRRSNFPASMNTTSTHDTKRGEDVRARLNVISDLPDEWVRFIRECVSWNENRKKVVEDKTIPDASEEYFIYQTLLGTLPMNEEADKVYLERIKEYFIKVLREAKIHSDWNNPDADYENAVNEFVVEILKDSLFMKHLFVPFFRRIRYFGIINSLSQVVLKCTCPGIPDFYQGTELWDFSLVDPDNRKPVNFEIHRKAIVRVSKHKNDSPLSAEDEGLEKLMITQVMMQERMADPKFWINAEYIPLAVYGDHKDHILAFARIEDSKWYITIVPLHMAEICHHESAKNFTWKNTRIELPPHAPVIWKMLWDKSDKQFVNEIPVDKILDQNIPVVLKGIKPDHGRAGGVLLHFTSLPGKYGTGNLGKVSFEFIGFLRKSGQKYWQILPFNTTDDSGSPYSSSSAFAGNTMLIDPEKLYDQHYLMKLPLPSEKEALSNFRRAGKITGRCMSQAYDNFLQQGRLTDKLAFEKFLSDNVYWLNDYVEFELLKKKFAGLPWTQWPDDFKNRDKKEIKKFMQEHEPESEVLKFAQYLFYRQFTELREYADSCGIKLIGDLSIYVSYDSADVWAHRELFDLDAGGNILNIAGVPPDLFSKTGQLWNMPVYNWERMKKTGYDWWKRRIRKTLEYCSLVRLDHFRGFSAYWSVAAGEKTAKNGEWKKGPGSDFFREMKREFTDLPFIAEDLGEIDDDVYRLRDEFNLPGMKVLQFAFDAQMPWSTHILHNHDINSVTYTGTHDNNTCKGWFKESADRAIRNRISEYAGRKITEETVCWDLIRMAYSSVSKIVIIPMQDILELDGSARFNTPSKPKGNWRWKLPADYFDHDLAEKLCQLSATYGRI
jgi:malto-oligosyltrehalose synthase/4-alpha-glucanotransferase